MRIAFYEPDIPQNTGTILRLTACLGLEAHIIEPTGFPSSDRAFRRAGMDYLDKVSLTRHVSWSAFDAWRRAERLRLVLFTTAAERSYLDHAYRRDDILLFGRESSGVPPEVHEAADVRLKIPIREGLRSLNIAIAAAMAAGEMVRQLRLSPRRFELFRPQQLSLVLQRDSHHAGRAFDRDVTEELHPMLAGQILAPAARPW